MGYKKILLALDGSKQSEQAIQHVVTIADTGADIHVLSVMALDKFTEMATLVGATNIPANTSDEQWPPIDPIDDPRALEARQKYLVNVTQWLEPLGYNVTLDARPGEIIPTILETARKGFDVIVMTTHQRSSIVKVVVGSIVVGV